MHLLGFWKIRQLSYKCDKLFWEINLFSYSQCFCEPCRIAWLRTDAHPALQSLHDKKIPVFNVLKKETAIKSVNISKEGHIKSAKTAQSSNWIFCPRPARSRFSLHGAPKTLQALQKSCESFSSSFYAAFYSSTSLRGSNKAKADERFEVKTFSEKQN